MINKNEQEWLRKFYEGTFVIKGWNGRIKELLGSVPPENKDAIRESLEELGDKIGREWIKDNSVRRIDTEMLRKWGEFLRAAKRDGTAALEKKIRQIRAEVEEILA